MQQPLAGIDVIDMGQIYQGGYCGLLLAYLGANVVKVEPPWGENVRTRSADGKPPQVQFLNANKRGITLDLRSEEGAEALQDLAETADVLLENFSTGTMERLGLGYDVLSELNPELIYAHGSGFGDDGPYAERPAMDLTIQAMSGVMDTTGFPDGPPVKAGPAVSDFMGGVHLALGIVAALHRRERSGAGDYVEVGMFDCMYPTLASPVSALVRERDAPPRTGNRHSGLAIAPYNVYEVADGYVAIICISERHWRSLTSVMGREDLAETEGYDSKAARAERMEEIDAIVADWLDGRSADDVEARLLDANVPCAKVRSVEEVIDDPHLRERGMVTDLPNQGDGRSQVPVPGMPISFAGSTNPEVTQAPLLGEHTAEVLAELGYDDDRIDRASGS